MEGLNIMKPSSNKREGFVQISVEEYDNLKEAEKLKEIPATIRYGSRVSIEGVYQPEEAIIEIDMYKLKRQICRQNGINPNTTTVKFY